MEQQQALKILNALANGVHPATGEVFAADSPYQHPDTVRALFEAVRSLEAGVQSANGPREASAANTFVRWSQEEEERLAAEFDSGKSTAELAKLHNRSRAAIEARLLKLGKIDVSASCLCCGMLSSRSTSANLRFDSSKLGASVHPVEYIAASFRPHDRRS